MCLNKRACRFLISFVIIASSLIITHADECTDNLRRCDRDTFGCRFRSYYLDMRSGVVCRGCNVCIKLGSPVDSTGCPQLECPDSSKLTIADCYRPEVYNRWVVYRGRKCKSCESMYCELIKTRG